MSASLVCPRCAQTLRSRQVGPALVAACVDCGGVWLGAEAARAVEAAIDRGVAEVASATDRAALAHIDDEAAVACPVCRAPLARLKAGDVDVDHCHAHGTWYDRGELVRVRDHLLALRGARPAGDVGDSDGSGLELGRAPDRVSAYAKNAAARLDNPDPGAHTVTQAERVKWREQAQRGQVYTPYSGSPRDHMLRSSDNDDAWDYLDSALDL